jgi:DnaK suppressor protein
MSRKQLLQKMRLTLLRRREALHRSLSGELRRFNAWEEPVVGDAADDALDTDYGVVNSQLAQTESRELVAIETALLRMREGTYGLCEDCGREIPLARLQALPYATSCVHCQRRLETQQERSSAGVDWSRVRDSDSSDDLRLDNFEFVL